ncbi:MAG: hypothetical protein K2P94_08920 [Rhodospirillaceae bacterium]|nr:hypothetical protein [Rhodospirillaceae bacterium]
MSVKSCLSVMALASAALAFNPAQAAESRSFVVNWFTDANYYAGEGAKSECPDGLNPSAIDFYRRDLLRIGIPKEKIEEALKDFPGEGGLTQPWVPMVMTRGNGKDNVYQFPETAPDPMLKTVKGKHGLGFNLDGRKDKNDFVDPITGEEGVDNQLYRAMGCIRSYRGLPPPGHPSQPEIHWDVLRNVMNAWIVTVTAENGFQQDGPVIVHFNRALQPITRAASGNVQPDMSYRLDPDPRTHNEFKGKLKEGMITTEASKFTMKFDEYIIHEMDFDKAKMRLEVKPDGSLEGYIGGYQPWYTIYYGIARVAHIAEYAASVDAPGVYYALKKLADADPDPATGQNRAISTTWHIEAVRAFTVGENQSVQATPSAQAR